MGFYTLITFLEDPKSTPSTLKLFYQDEVYKEFSLVSLKEGEEKIEHIGEVKRKKISEIAEGINNTTALHLAVLKNRPDITEWLISHKPKEFVEKVCCLRTEENFLLYEQNSSHLPAEWRMLNDGKRIYEHTERCLTAQELAEYLGNECYSLFRHKLRLC